MSYGPMFAAAVDVTGGTLDLPVGARGIENLRLVDLVDSGVVLAEALDLPVTGGFRRGSCWGLLAPSAHRWMVVLMGTTPADLAGSGIEIGRLSDDDAHRWASRFAGRPLRVAIVIEGTPGFDRVDVRFRSDLLARPLLPPPPADLAPPAPAASPPPIAPPPFPSTTVPPPPVAPPVTPAPAAPAPVAETPQPTSHDEPASWPPPAAPVPQVVPEPQVAGDEPTAPAVEPDLPAAHGLPDTDQQVDAVEEPETVVAPHVEATMHDTYAPPEAPTPPEEPVAPAVEPDLPAAQGLPDADQQIGAVEELEPVATPYGEPTAHEGDTRLEETELREVPLVTASHVDGVGAETEAWAPSTTEPGTDTPATVLDDGADHAVETPWSIDVRDGAVGAAEWTDATEPMSGYEAAIETEPLTVPAIEPEPELASAPVTEADLEAVPAPPPPPGWYPDPGDARFWRRWDGTQWTDEASAQPPGLAAS